MRELLSKKQIDLKRLERPFLGGSHDGMRRMFKGKLKDEAIQVWNEEDRAWIDGTVKKLDTYYDEEADNFNSTGKLLAEVEYADSHMEKVNLRDCVWRLQGETFEGEKLKGFVRPTTAHIAEGTWSGHSCRQPVRYLMHQMNADQPVTASLSRSIVVFEQQQHQDGVEAVKVRRDVVELPWPAEMGKAAHDVSVDANGVVHLMYSEAASERSTDG